MPITIDGVSYPLFNPDLWSFWLPWFLVVLGLQIVFHLALYLRGGWTWAFAAVNTILNLAFVVPAVWLWSEGLLFDPGLVAALEGMGLAAAFRPAGVVIAIVLIAATGWDIARRFPEGSPSRPGAASRPRLTTAIHRRVPAEPSVATWPGGPLRPCARASCRGPRQ